MTNLEKLSSKQQLAWLLEAYKYRWSLHARPEQSLPEGDWQTWLLKAGRGWGKTRTGAETVRYWAQYFRFVNLIGATADDARDIMIEGESGILAICPPQERPVYKRSARQLIWPTGAKSLVFTADEPERLRGKQHEKLWCDELASWRYPEAWHQAMLGLRLGSNPQAVVTTTPRPIKILRELIADPKTIISGGSSFENRANLAPAFFDRIIGKYKDTNLGRQEIWAEMLNQIEGALWSLTLIDSLRVQTAPKLGELERIVVGVDPSVTAAGDEAGIVVAARGKNGEAYVLQDSSLQASPAVWGSKVISAFHSSAADRVVAEVNNGGELVKTILQTIEPNLPYKAVHASRGKRPRAEPIAALYEQHKVHHVGVLSKLEDEMCTWTPDEPSSPNRMDALVWALTELMLTKPAGVATGRYA